MHTLTWHGHSNFQIDTKGLTILIDPFFDGNPTADVTAQAVTKADLVLVTHDHRDHAGQAVDICKRTGAGLVAVVETAARLVGQGLPHGQVVNGIGINVGGAVTVKGVTVTMVQAAHSSESGVAVGYILTLEDGYTLYHSGDTGLFASMELFGRLYDLDLALLPIGGVFTMDPRQAALACRLLGCKAVVPMHWGTFPVLESDSKAFAAELERLAPDVRLFTMQPGSKLPLDRVAPTDCACD